MKRFRHHYLIAFAVFIAFLFASLLFSLMRVERRMPVRASTTTEVLWGTAQVCTAGAIVDPGSSIDGRFDNLVAYCAGRYAQGAQGTKSWTIKEIGDTALTIIAEAVLDVRFLADGWLDDTLVIELFDGNAWHVLPGGVLDPANPPPMTTLETRTFTVTSYLSNTLAVNAAQVRLRGEAEGPNADAENMTILLDGVRLTVLQVLNDPPAVTILSPVDGSRSSLIGPVVF